MKFYSRRCLVILHVVWLFYMLFGYSRRCLVILDVVWLFYSVKKRILIFTVTTQCITYLTVYFYEQNLNNGIRTERLG